MQLDIQTFFGRFHPLIVHLPIGFLLLAIFFSLLSLKKKHERLRSAISPSLLLGSVSAAFACITGYILSMTGDYDTEELSSHLWAGIITTVFAFVSYFMSLNKASFPFLRKYKTLIGALVVLFIFINITGHLGGSLTHGSDFLSLSVLLDKKHDERKIADINNAYVFADLVQPLLEKKCGSCHNRSKMKGRLSIEDLSSLLKGGKHGPAIKPGAVSESELIRRISLDPKDEKFMPTDGKPPLTADETAIIKWWIETAATGADKKILVANPPGEVKKIAVALLGPEDKAASEDKVQVNTTAPPVSKDVMEKLKTSGFVIKFLHLKPDLLDVTLPASNGNENTSEKLKGLLQAKDNILWLNVSDNNISDDHLAVIGQFKNLERLKLDRNPISDKGAQSLIGLKKLQSLNLYGTKITIHGLAVLSKLNSLKRVYVWNTGIKEQELKDGKLPFSIIGSSKK